MFLENGPYRVNPDLSLNMSTGGWQDHANIVFGKCAWWFLRRHVGPNSLVVK
jgi:hypothetical protein